MSEITSVFAMEVGLHILYNTCEAVKYEDTLERARVPPDLFGPLEASLGKCLDDGKSWSARKSRQV
jgi:hypothetical protein